jgi:hypothetical protein
MVVIELDASQDAPTGVISVDGGRRRTFYGWIDLTAQLEALMAATDVTSSRPPARAGRARHG